MGKALVTYFSASGVTAKMAQRLASAIKADLFEIQPETPYTEADLDWRNDKSRSSVEMKDKSSRPPIAAKVADMSQYDVVFVGFPVWWYREPSIIDTFLEQYDFAGKTLIPFCTSGGSGLGETPENFRRLAPGATVLEGKRLSHRDTEASLRAWVDSL